MTSQQIINLLPYETPFLFVDTLTKISDKGIEGNYTLKKESGFYKGHFKNNPVTPGVILTEIMAQIGVVCLGILLLKKTTFNKEYPKIALTSSAVDFFLPILPGEKVNVVSEKTFFRFNKLQCKVQLFKETGALACRGTISGMFANGK